MKHYLFIFYFLFSFGVLSSQNETLVEVTDQRNAELTTKMNQNASALLTELNTAFFSNVTINLEKIDMTEEAKESVMQIWENSSFRCIESWIMPRCLNTNSGFQIRNIPVIIKEGNENQDAVINFNAAGTIVSFYFAVEKHQYQAIMRAGLEETDLRRRQMILDFIENFRTAYNRKDLPLIDIMYSDYALIITGNICKAKDGYSTVEYTSQSKKEYLTRLRRVFELNKYVNIGFDDIEIMKHPTNDKVYGVTLRQAWNTSNYSDDGWLFLAIHFESETQMEVDVRTWQPYMLNGNVFPREEVFNIVDFEF